MFWASVVVTGIYAFTMLSLFFLSRIVGRRRAYHKTMWILGRLTERFNLTGRYRKATEQASGVKESET